MQYCIGRVICQLFGTHANDRPKVYGRNFVSVSVSHGIGILLACAKGENYALAHSTPSGSGRDSQQTFLFFLSSNNISHYHIIFQAFSIIPNPVSKITLSHTVICGINPSYPVFSHTVVPISPVCQQGKSIAGK